MNSPYTDTTEKLHGRSTSPFVQSSLDHTRLSTTSIIASATNLANPNVSPQRTRVEILEELHAQSTRAHKLKRSPSTRGALMARHDVRMAGLKARDGPDATDGSFGHGVVGGLLRRRRRQLVDGDPAPTVERVRRSLQRRLLGEEEDERAGLAGVRGGQIEVEDGAFLWGDGAVVLRAVGLVGLGRVDGYDEVREFVRAVQVCWAASARCRRWSVGRAGGRRWWSCRRWRGRSCYGIRSSGLRDDRRGSRLRAHHCSTASTRLESSPSWRTRAVRTTVGGAGRARDPGSRLRGGRRGSWLRVQGSNTASTRLESGPNWGARPIGAPVRSAG